MVLRPALIGLDSSWKPHIPGRALSSLGSERIPPPPRWNLAENSPCGRLENELTQISVGSRGEGSANRKASPPRRPRIGCGENQLSNNRSAGSFDLLGTQTAIPDSRPEGGQKAHSLKAAGLRSHRPHPHPVASCVPNPHSRGGGRLCGEFWERLGGSLHAEIVWKTLASLKRNS